MPSLRNHMMCSQRLSTAAVGLTALCLLIVLGVSLNSSPELTLMPVAGRSAVRLRQIRPCDSIVPATVRHWARAALCRMGCLGLGSMVGIVYVARLIQPEYPI
jgi:hypothetical protein